MKTPLPLLSRHRFSPLPLAVLVLAALPAAVEACPVCFAAKEQTRTAFVATTVFMTVLPLSMISGFVYWLKGKFAAAAAAEEDRES
ncbi:MAG: hypothetical protein KDM91_14475 [Verrucomicrobiae bacterium]|nr:hypothetical protein [Verrucomicrobiae bacterium]